MKIINHGSWSWVKYYFLCGMFLGLTNNVGAYVSSYSYDVDQLDFKVIPNKDIQDSSLWPTYIPKEYFKIKSIEVQEIKPLDILAEKKFSTTSEEEVDVESPDDGYTEGENLEEGNDPIFSDIIAIVDNLVAIGTKLWEIVKEGKPVVNTDFFKPVQVLPYIDDQAVEFAVMDQWQMPAYRTFKVSYYNLMKVEVVSFVYTVYFQYGGKYRGIGNYLTGVNVAAGEIYVGWGFNFNATSKVVNVSNNGLQDDPVAGLTMHVQYQVESPLSTVIADEAFHLTGNGELIKLQESKSLSITDAL